MVSYNDKESRKKLLSEHGFSEQVCSVLSDYPCVDLLKEGKRKIFLEDI